jgi:tRNA G18 (ribose-2'-O)-methylase SpoU
VRLWQALAALSPAAPAATLDALLAILARNNAADVKQYQEIAAVAAVASSPGLLEASVLPALREYEQQRAGAVPSLVSVAAYSALAARASLGADAWHALLLRVLRAILPWCGSFVHASRTFAQLAVWRMLEVAPPLAAADPSLAAFLAFFQGNHDLNRLRASMGVAAGLDAFDLARATSPRGLLLETAAVLGAGAGAGAGAGPAGGPLEGAPPALLASLEAYLMEERAALKAVQAAHMGESAAQDAARRAPPAAAAAAPPPPPRQDSWQRKITPSDRGAAVADPWGAALGLAALAAPCADPQEIEMCGAAGRAAAAAAAAAAAPAAGAAGGGQPRQELIVVASLLDKIPNLAGLARTCEVFRAARLVLPDLAVAADPQFAQISVSAERWVPLEAVSPAALGPWLQRKAAQGWAVVGLEQTADSVPLQRFRFPRRCVLVLGAERRGVPAPLLALLHATVEIPQLGVVRSLNVHVAGAVAVFEYTRQGLLEGEAAAAGVCAGG